MPKHAVCSGKQCTAVLSPLKLAVQMLAIALAYAIEASVNKLYTKCNYLTNEMWSHQHKHKCKMQIRHTDITDRIDR